MNINNVLFATSEIAPQQPISQITNMTMQLPPAIKTLRRHIYVVVPAYPALLTTIGNTTLLTELNIKGLDAPVSLLEGKLPGSSVKLLLADIPGSFDPANNVDKTTKISNNEYFAHFCQVVVAIAQGEAKLSWQPQLVHCNGWQTGLVPALLAHHGSQVATLFTLHKPDEQQHVAIDQLTQWGLPPSLTTDSAIITEGQLCFTKAALRYADSLSTASPTYAKEICTSTFGCGVEYLLQQRQQHLFGILHGVNYQQWNPAKDKLLPRSYNSHTLDDKVLSKLALQRAFNLPPRERCCLIGIIGDLTSKEGADLLLDIIPKLLQQDIQIILLGKGEIPHVSRLRDLCFNNSEKIAAHIRENNRLSHLIIGGADIYLALSSHPPYAINSRLALRYGTVPVVNNSGALADSVIDTNKETLSNDTASGFLLDLTNAHSLLSTLNRAIAFYQQHPKEWKKVAINGMQQDFSWRRTAKQYIDLYKKTIEARGNIGK